MLRINDELLQLCKWLEGRNGCSRTGNTSSKEPRYWFIQSAPTGRLAAAFWCQAAMLLHQFTASMKELAEWFGLELSRIAVDDCLVTHT
jgi:hypothetical protein